MSKTRINPFLKWGYVAGVVLGFIGLLASALYLFVFIAKSPMTSICVSELELISITVERRLMLLSAGIFVAMSFGFLGFALFLIQANGDMDVDLHLKDDPSKSDYKLKLAKLSPGAFAIGCATVIIVVCVTHRIEYEIRPRSGDLNPSIGHAPADTKTLGLSSSAPSDTK